MSITEMIANLLGLVVGAFICGLGILLIVQGVQLIIWINSK